MSAASNQDLYRNCRFLVQIDGLTESGFTEVLMAVGEITVMEYREGNALGPGRKLPGHGGYGPITLKQALTKNRELWNWWKATLTGQVERRNGIISLLNTAHEEVARWKFRDSWPIKYSTTDLKAEGNEVVMETIVLAHEGIELE
jgi:phage tail-like protein